MRSLFHRPVATPVEPATDAEALAYARLEEARLRVEWLGSCLPQGRDGPAEPDLGACHRHLGLAGFHCSAELESGARLQWLALAHDRLRGDECDPVRASLDAIACATETVEHALIASDLADHVESAHGHLLVACAAFGAYLQLEPSS